MAAIIGRLDCFDENTEDWNTYIERFEHFLTANDIPAERRVAALLSVIGGKTYSLLRSLIAPEKPGAKSYNEIVQTLQEHFSPKPLVIAESSI